MPAPPRPRRRPGRADATTVWLKCRNPKPATHDITMSTFSLKSIGSIIALATAAHLPAAELGETSMNEFRFGPSFGFNITAKFSGFQPYALAPSPAAGSLVDRNYVDGYMRVDSSGNAGNQTWNWGYQNSAQYNQAASNMNFHGLAVHRS